jgi:hypothetical protein
VKKNGRKAIIVIFCLLTVICIFTPAVLAEDPNWQYKEIVRSIKKLGYIEYIAYIYVGVSNRPPSWLNPLRAPNPPTQTEFSVVLKEGSAAEEFVEKMANEIKALLDNEYTRDKKGQQGDFKNVELFIKIQEPIDGYPKVIGPRTRDALLWRQARAINSYTNEFEWK